MAQSKVAAAEQEEIGMKLDIAKALALCALLAAAGTLSQAAQATEFDAAMAPILTEYLKIQTALAADGTEGVVDAVQKIENRAKKLDPAKAEEDHAQHYQNIPQDIIAACEKLHDAKDIASVREAFRELSMPVSMWVTMAKPEGKRVMYCSMKKAGWVQEGSKVANPYYGAEMLECGHEVGEGH